MIVEKSDSVRELLTDIELVLAGTENDASFSARRCAREIVATILDVTPGEVSRRVALPVSAASREHAIEAATRHAAGEPLAYALQSAAFRNLVLYVDRRVLIPRSETEIVVDEALKVAAGQSGGIAVDVGTGSGAIALSLATEGAFSGIIATDISKDALDVAARNVARYAVRPSMCGSANDGSHRQQADDLVQAEPSGDFRALHYAVSNAHGVASFELRLGPDLQPLEGMKARVLVSNPPYIAFDEEASLPASVRDWEPPLALFAHNGGMERYEVLLRRAPDVLEPGGWIVLEVDARRAELTKALAEGGGRYREIRLVKDLTQRDRVLVARVAS